MDHLVKEDSKEYLESIAIAVKLKNPIDVFDGFTRSKTDFGYIIGDLFFGKPEHDHPLIFEKTLIWKHNNAAESTYTLDKIGEYEILPNIKMELQPVYLINSTGKRVFSYFRIL